MSRSGLLLLADDVRPRALRERQDDDLVDVDVRASHERERDAVGDVLGAERSTERDVFVDGAGLPSKSSRNARV